MTEQTSKPPIQVSSKAEGEPDNNRERLEPATSLRTSTVPAVREPTTLSTSDTGVNFVVKLHTDGTDTDDEQDASLTQGEKILDTKSDPNAEMSDTTMKSPVLIVEDTVELAEVIQATLEGMGLDSTFETHGKTGLEKLKELNPELVIMDIGLPDITGWKMLDHIKEHYTENESAMPTIIVITAYGDPANRLIGKLQNIHSYLIKPFTPDQVERVVNMVLRGEKPDDPTLGTASSAG